MFLVIFWGNFQYLVVFAFICLIWLWSLQLRFEAYSHYREGKYLSVYSTFNIILIFLFWSASLSCKVDFLINMIVRMKQDIGKTPNGGDCFVSKMDC